MGRAIVKHVCHARGCMRECPPRWLMCRECWARVPADLASEVYRTVKLRGSHVDASWAPWWRAQARAIAHVAKLTPPIDPHVVDKYLEHELAFANRLEARP